MYVQDTQRQAQIAETLYFSLFPKERPKDFKRLLLFSVYSKIKASEGITVNKLKWVLQTELSMQSEDIDIALQALCNPSLFYAVSKFNMKVRKPENRNKKIVHLRLRKDQQHVISYWIDQLLETFPEYENISSA